MVALVAVVVGKRSEAKSSSVRQWSERLAAQPVLDAHEYTGWASSTKKQPPVVVTGPQEVRLPQPLAASSSTPAAQRNGQSPSTRNWQELTPN